MSLSPEAVLSVVIQAVPGHGDVPTGDHWALPTAVFRVLQDTQSEVQDGGNQAKLGCSPSSPSIRISGKVGRADGQSCGNSGDYLAKVWTDESVSQWHTYLF